MVKYTFTFQGVIFSLVLEETVIKIYSVILALVKELICFRFKLGPLLF